MACEVTGALTLKVIVLKVVSFEILGLETFT
jgi:hypothetical protein